MLKGLSKSFPGVLSAVGSALGLRKMNDRMRVKDVSIAVSETAITRETRSIFSISLML